MVRHRGNPNWGKPEPAGPFAPTVTSFELFVLGLDLTPDQYEESPRLREWAKRNKGMKYVPEKLLKAWGLEVQFASWEE